MPEVYPNGPMRRAIQSEARDLPVARPESPGGWWSGLGDTYALGSYGQFKDMVEQTIVRNETRVPGFEALDHIPAGYEMYAEDFMWAQSPEEVAAIAGNIDENNDIRARLAKHSVGRNLAYGLIAGIFDPINLVAGPALKGVGFVKGALMGGVAYGSLNAAQELVRHKLDPTSTAEETAFNVGAGYVLSGLISGGIGHFTGRPPSALREQVRAQADSVGDNVAKALAIGDGIYLDDVIPFHAQGVRVVDAPTNKFDPDGNPVAAFFRDKANLEARARGERVQRAVDSALGDVIPEERLADELVDDDFVGVRIEPEDADLPPWDIGEAGKRLDEAADEVVIREDGNPLDDADAALPFRSEADGDAPAGRGAGDAADELEDTVFVDTALVLRQFAEKRWTQPRHPGIDPFPEDAFGTPQEWLNFVILHELNHKTTKQLPTEDMVTYENRINRMAYEEMRAERLPLSPIDNAIARSTLAFSPTKQLMNLAPRSRVAHDAWQDLSGNMGTTNIGNEAGKATSPGGSALQRSTYHRIHLFKTQVAVRKAYAEYLKGLKPDTPVGALVTTLGSDIPKIGSAARRRKLTYRQFNKYVGRAQYEDQPFEMHGHPLSDADMQLVRRAASEMDASFRDLEKKINALGMFDAQRNVQREMDWRARSLEQDEAWFAAQERNAPVSVLQRVEARILDNRERLAVLEQTAAELAANPVMPKGETRYFPRIYHIANIKARFDDFVDLLASSFEGPEARVRAKEVAEAIIGEGGDDTQFGFGMPRHVNGRVIDLTNAELGDFIVNDATLVMGIYVRRMGPAIEVFEKFGSLDMAAKLDEIEGKMLREGMEPDKVRKVLELMEDQRDRVLGRFHGSDPLSLQNRIVRTLKAYGNVTLMGEAIFSQMVDAARLLANEGYRPMFAAMRAAFSKDGQRWLRGADAKAFGEGYEISLAQLGAQMIDTDSALLPTAQTGFERGMANAQTLMFNMNLMNPYTVGLKNLASVMASHSFIKESKMVAAALRSGRTIEQFTKAEQRVLSRLASYGINPRTAQMIADMPAEKLDSEDLWKANIDNWTGTDGRHAADAFRAAVNGKITQSVLTPGPQQRPAIFEGVFRWKGQRKEIPALALPFQLMSFTMASGARIGHAIVSGRDPQRGVTIASMLAGGALSTWARMSEEQFDRLTIEEFIWQTIERSGLLLIFGDILRRTEDLTGYGPRKMVGMYDPGEGVVNDEIGTVAGPSLGVIAGMIEAFANPDMSDRQRAAQLRRGVIFNNMVWFDETLKDASKALADAGFMPSPGEEAEQGELMMDDEAAMDVEAAPAL